MFWPCKGGLRCKEEEEKEAYQCCCEDSQSTAERASEWASVCRLEQCPTHTPIMVFRCCEVLLCVQCDIAYTYYYSSVCHVTPTVMTHNLGDSVSYLTFVNMKVYESMNIVMQWSLLFCSSCSTDLHHLPKFMREWKRTNEIFFLCWSTVSWGEPRGRTPELGFCCVVSGVVLSAGGWGEVVLDLLQGTS